MPDLIPLQPVLNLIAALCFGAVIGIERQWRQRLAGLRTNTLVSLGAGIIFREGFNVRGLNTAATLWCAAAIGMLAGAVVFVNLALRPLARVLDRQPIQTTELIRYHAVGIVCKGTQEAHVRALMLQGFAENGLHLTGLESENIEDTDRVEVTAEVNADTTSDSALEQIVGRLSLEPAVTAARWSIRETGYS